MYMLLCIKVTHNTHNHWVDMLSFLMDHNIWVDMCTEYSKSSGHQFHDIIIITDFVLSRATGEKLLCCLAEKLYVCVRATIQL